MFFIVSNVHNYANKFIGFIHTCYKVVQSNFDEACGCVCVVFVINTYVCVYIYDVLSFVGQTLHRWNYRANQERDQGKRGSCQVEMMWILNWHSENSRQWYWYFYVAYICV